MSVTSGVMPRARVCLLALALSVSASVLAGQAPASSPPASAVMAPDGRRTAWIADDGSSIWSATRPGRTAVWAAATRLLTIRGIVRALVFSPDGTRLAFENLRAGTTAATRGDTWAFIAVCDLGTRRIRYVDPSFEIDSDPAWSADGRQISFVRTTGGVAGARVTRAAPDFLMWTLPPARPSEPFSLASILALPYVYAPEASGDGRSLAYVSREGVHRNVYFLRLGEPARRIVNFAGDDGQELTQVAVSQTGRAVAFVRGALTNPTSLPDPPQPEIWIAGTRVDTARRIGFGTAPRFSTDEQRVSWTAVTGGGQMTATLTWTNGRLTGAGASGPVTGARPSAGTASPDGTRTFTRRQDALDVQDVATKTTWTIPLAGRRIDAGPVWSPDSRYIAFRQAAGGVHGSAGINGYRFNGVPVADEPWTLWIADVRTSEVRRVFQARAGMGSVAAGPIFWSDDGRVAFEWEGDGWKHYYSVRATGGEPTLMTRGDGDVEFARVSHDHKHLIVTSNIGDLGRRHITIVDFNGGPIAIIRQGTASQWAPVELADGALAYLEAGHASPPAVMIRQRDGSTMPAGLPRVLASFPASRLVEPLLVEFPGTDGQTAFGQLFIPTESKGCGVIFAHGGIRRQMLPGFHYMDAYAFLYELNQYLVSRGCVVLSVEYRSSIMRGYAFRHAPGWGFAGATEMLDVVGGAKYLMARADVDASRGVGVYGLSWGGYITAQALARHSDIFSVGFDMAGVHESLMPEDHAHAPLAHLDGWRSPILLAQGDDDRNVSFSQGLMLARALPVRRPDVEFVQRVFPNETHDIYLTFENMVTIYQEGADFLLDRLIGVKRRAAPDVRR